DATHFPAAGVTVSIHYVGRIQTAEKGLSEPFDSSRARGRPLLAKLGADQLIRAMEDVLPHMSVGQVVQVVAPPHYAYGRAGWPPIIPPNATLVFELELVSFM
ncbi:putative FKBP-type peptidyl-prolyl cis-trans isomerase, partial [Tribonema minus]